MKLNYGKTFLLGFGFFSIMAVGPIFFAVALVLMMGVRRGEATLQANPLPAGG